MIFSDTRFFSFYNFCTPDPKLVATARVAKQQALSNNQCPKDSTGAVDASQSQKWDAVCTRDQKNRAKQQQENNEQNNGNDL